MPAQKFDLESITLAEMVEVEIASGKDFMVLLRSRTGRLMIARFLLALRQHENDTASPAPEWNGDQRLLGVSNLILPLSPDGGQPKSDG